MTTDQSECGTWASQQSAYNPSEPGTAAYAAASGSGPRVATLGQTVPGLFGGIERREERRLARRERRSQENVAYAGQQHDAYNRALDSCLSARGYTVRSPEPTIPLHHLVIHRDGGGGIYVADKQLYASRYTDTALLVLWLAPPPDGKGYYLLAGLRVRNHAGGFAARLLRGRIEETSRSDTEIYLDWIRKSLAPGR